MQSLLFWIATVLYALATVAYFTGASFRWARGADVGRALLGVALLPHAASLVLRWVEVGHGPYQTRYESISADAMILVIAWFAASALGRGMRALGVFVAPTAFLMMGVAVSNYGLRREVPIIFKSSWVILHIGFAQLFFAAIVLASACAVAWLLKARSESALPAFPPLERLDLYGHQFMLVSFLFLGVMIAAGALWAQESWGRYWGWDPIETSSLVTWSFFAIVLHFRVLHRWSGRRMAWLTIASLVFALVTLFAVVIAAPTIHNSYMVGG